MSVAPASRINGLVLAIGAALMLLGVFTKPGGILIASQPGTALAGRVMAMGDNATLTHISSLISLFGLLMILAGLYGLRRALVGETAGDAWARAGIVAATFAIVAYAITQGMNHMIAHVISHGLERGLHPQETLVSLAVHVQSVKLGIQIVGGYGYLLGFGLIALGLNLRFPAGGHKTLSFVVFLIAAVGFVLIVIADHFHSLTVLYRIAALAVIPVNIWAVIIGLAMRNGHPSLTPAQSES